MQLIIYPFIVCVGIFLIQLFFIIRKNKIVYNDIQKKDKKHWKLVIKILVALIIKKKEIMYYEKRKIFNNL